jgi:Domain of unknown function (DUF4383)
MRMLRHLPVNHRLRGLYRFLAALTGLYVLVYGIVGLFVCRGQDPFARTDTQALGLRTNLAFSIMSIVVGAVVLIGIAVDHNWDHVLNFFGGLAFLVVGMLMLGLLQTDLNVFNYNVTKCVVSFIIGVVLFLAGLYSRVGPPEEAQAEEATRVRGTAVTAAGG